MRAQRHIRCPRCNREGHLPEGYAKARVRCPNPGCHHVFALSPVGGLAAEAEGYDRELAAAIWEVTTRGDKTAPELDGYLLADVDSPARPRVGAPTQPPPAAPAARPRSADTETRPDRGPEPSVVRGPEPEIAGRRRWWVVATVGGLTLAVLLFGIGAWVIRPDNDKKTLRDSEPLAGVATRLPAGPGGARDETGLAPEPPAAAPIAKAVPPADQVADGGTDRGGPAKDVPGEDVPEAKAVPPVEQTAPAPPADPPIGDPGRSSDATAEPTAVKHLRPGDDDRGFHAERRRAEAVLLEAGLKRVSNSYILPEEVEAGNLATAIAKRQPELEKLMRKYRDLEWQYNASRASHSRRMSEAARMGNESSVSQSLSQEESRDRGEIRKLEEEIAPVQREIEDDQMRYRMIETRTLPQYAELAARPRSRLRCGS